jgi:hypothetical protein
VRCATVRTKSNSSVAHTRDNIRTTFVRITSHPESDPAQVVCTPVSASSRTIPYNATRETNAQMRVPYQGNPPRPRSHTPGTDGGDGRPEFQLSRPSYKQNGEMAAP